MADHINDEEVTFVFPNENGATLKAKKSMLSEKSEVFKKLFESGMEQNQISIEDISFKAFDLMIKHLQGGQINVDIDFLELLYVSRKYFLNSLTTIIIGAAKRFFTSNRSRCAQHYGDIKKFNLPILDEYMKKYLCLFVYDTIPMLKIASDEHLEILKDILQSETLGCSEAELYNSIMDMIKRSKGTLTWDEAKKRMGKLIYLIRFPTMTYDELILYLEPPSLLTRDQICDLLLWVKKGTFSETIVRFHSFNKRISTSASICQDHYGEWKCETPSCPKSTIMSKFLKLQQLDFE